VSIGKSISMSAWDVVNGGCSHLGITNATFSVTAFQFLHSGCLILSGHAGV
jgi:hypothetical protein